MPLPTAPKGYQALLESGTSANLEALNEEAYKVFYDRALKPCENCGRKFLHERLQVHIRSCNKAYGKPVPLIEGPGMARQQDRLSETPERKAAEESAWYREKPKPRIILCYIW